MKKAKTRVNVSNVLVIGCGAAGLRAAIAAHEMGADVVIAAKRARRDAHTVLAAGGINAALGNLDPEDNWKHHFADTLIEGYGLGDPQHIELMTKEAPAAIRELAEWGCEFARTEAGDLDQRFFGAHRFRRTCYAGDWTGRAIIRTLGRRVLELGIPIIEGVYISDLLVSENVCFGAYAFDLQTGERIVFQADSVVLAAGGHTRIWRRSSSRRDENNGEGMALALRAGARLSDMELVQFHPTGMVTPEEMGGTLVTEAVRGEGGRLFNANGERYMERYDPERLELSTRDRIALANYTEIREGRGTENGGVLLDISHRQREDIIRLLPRMYRQFLDSQLLDISQKPMEVAPTAHYSMGGVVVDAENHLTDVEGLYAAGEVTCGLHGANRLGGNSLTETVVFGKRAGHAAADRALTLRVSLREPTVVRSAKDRLDAMIRPGSEFARPLQRALRDKMWEHCGVVRDEAGLQNGIQEVREIADAAQNIDVRPSSEGFADLAHALDLRAATTTAEATLIGALRRQESRGAHNRLDFPERDDSQELHFDFSLSEEDSKLALSVRQCERLDEELRQLIDDRGEISVAGRLLE